MESHLIVEEIFALYGKHGFEDYIGETISQIEHMSQASQLAIAEGFDDEVILAAFFHDLGHICKTDRPMDAQMGGYGTKNHESLGAAFLRDRGFSERIASLVESHVNTKRYLCFKNPNYYSNLSQASKITLTYQGGVMIEEEAIQFEACPFFKEKIAIRRFDEAAKIENVPIIDLSILKKKAVDHLENVKR